MAGLITHKEDYKNKKYTNLFNFKPQIIEIILDICVFFLVICCCYSVSVCNYNNAMLFQMDSLPLIDAIIFSVNIYKYKTEINSIEPILGVPGPGWDNQMD